MDTALLDRGFERLAETGSESPRALRAFKDWILASETVQRVRINPYEIAAASNEPVDDIVSVALNGAASGLFDMHWLVHCPHCNMITAECDNFFELTQTSSCKMCELAFKADFLARVEVAFSLNRAIDGVDMAAFCLPPPALRSKVNIAVMPGEKDAGSDVIDEPGLYRYFCPITLAKGLLRVTGEQTESVQSFKIRQCPSLNYDQTTLSARPGPVRFELVNECEPGQRDIHHLRRASGGDSARCAAATADRASGRSLPRVQALVRRSGPVGSGEHSGLVGRAAVHRYRRVHADV